MHTNKFLVFILHIYKYLCFKASCVTYVGCFGIVIYLSIFCVLVMVIACMYLCYKVLENNNNNNCFIFIINKDGGDRKKRVENGVKDDTK